MPERLTPEDRWAIDDVVSAYVLRLDIDDIDGAAALFAEDAEFDTYGRVFVGRDRIRRMFASAPKGLHLAGRTVVTATTAGADVRMQLVFFPADAAPRRLAVYNLRLVESGAGTWSIQHMECRFLNSQGILSPEP